MGGDRTDTEERPWKDSDGKTTHDTEVNPRGEAMAMTARGGQG